MVTLKDLFVFYATRVLLNHNSYRTFTSLPISHSVFISLLTTKPEALKQRNDRYLLNFVQLSEMSEALNSKYEVLKARLRADRQNAAELRAVRLKKIDEECKMKRRLQYAQRRDMTLNANNEVQHDNRNSRYEATQVIKCKKRTKEQSGARETMKKRKVESSEGQRRNVSKRVQTFRRKLPAKVTVDTQQDKRNSRCEAKGQKRTKKQSGSHKSTKKRKAESLVSERRKVRERVQKFRMKLTEEAKDRIRAKDRQYRRQRKLKKLDKSINEMT